MLDRVWVYIFGKNCYFEVNIKENYCNGYLSERCMLRKDLKEIKVLKERRIEC